VSVEWGQFKRAKENLGFFVRRSSVTPLSIIVTTRESVNLGVFLAGSEVEDVFVRVEDEGPPNLAAGKYLGGVEVFEIFVVGVDLDRVWGALEVVSPDFEAVDNSEEFFVVDFVVAFGGEHFSGVKRDGSKFTVWAGL
jgi:hypothetical protein